MWDEDSPLGFSDITVDKEGRWFYRGAEIIRREIVELFCRHLVRVPAGQYVIRWRGQECPVQVEDTPFVIWSAAVVRGDGGPIGVLLEISDGTSEMLDPRSLRIGPENVPYCAVHEGTAPARFSRKAYYQLVRMVEEDPRGGGFGLRIGDQRYPIRMEPERAWRT
jgi:hypothetical protein